MKNSPKYLAQLSLAFAAFTKALRGRDIDAGAYLVALASIEAMTRIGVRFLELKAGIL